MEKLIFLITYQMTKIADMFLDYSKEEIGKHISIELEVAHADARKIVDKYPQVLRAHGESSKIYEIVNIHKLDIVDRKSIYGSIAKIYKDTFPIGADEYLSGWVHFHAFMKKNMERDEIEQIEFKLNFEGYKDNYHALPLYAKANNMTFYRRQNGGLDNYSYSAATTIMGTMMSGNYGWRHPVGGFRSSFRTTRVEYPEFRSVEFRCNNILDTRIYGYYIGQMLLAEAGIKLEQLSTKVEATSNPKPRGYTINISELQGTTYTWDDVTKIKRNLKLLLAVLRKNKFTKAAYNLNKYAKDMQII